MFKWYYVSSLCPFGHHHPIGSIPERLLANLMSSPYARAFVSHTKHWCKGSWSRTGSTPAITNHTEVTKKEQLIAPFFSWGLGWAILVPRVGNVACI